MTSPIDVSSMTKEQKDAIFQALYDECKGTIPAETQQNKSFMNEPTDAERNVLPDQPLHPRSNVSYVRAPIKTPNGYYYIFYDINGVRRTADLDFLGKYYPYEAFSFFEARITQRK